MGKLLRKHNTVTRGGTCRGRRRGGLRALDIRCAILLRDQPSELDAEKYCLAAVNEVLLKISKNVSLQNKCHFREVHLYAFFVAVQSTFRRMDARCPFRTSAVNAACWKRGAARQEPQMMAVLS